MKILKSLILLLIICISFSCQKESSSSTTTPTPTPTPTKTAPVADFSYSGAGVAPSTVTFTNSSTNATSYSWDFGDNSTSSEVSPSHKFTAGGVYTVKLTATGSGGTNSTTKTINITSPTTLKILSVKLISIPLTRANGGSWDALPTSGPDVYIKITDDVSTTFYNHPSYFIDVVAGNLPLNFELQNSSKVLTPLTITSANFSKKIALEVWDFDVLVDEKMIALTLLPSSLTTGASAYPTTATGTVDGLTVQFTLQWQ
jgi:PKD repeat protein